MRAMFTDFIFNREEEETLLPGAEYVLSGLEMQEKLAPLINDQEYIEVDVVDQRFRERDLVQMIKDNAQKLTGNDVVRRTDLFYDMFPSYTDEENESVWCIPLDHPLHIIMEEHMGREPYAVVEVEHIRVPLGIWLEDDLQDAVDRVVAQFDDASFVPATDVKKDK